MATSHAEPVAVERATPADIPAWIELAAEVEPEFGAPMAKDSNWIARLRQHVDDGTAWCVRATTGGPVVGGMLLASRDEALTIGWLAVRRSARRRGAGRALVETALDEAAGSPVDVVTFGADHPLRDAARAARALYESLGFVASEVAPPDGPDGTPRVAYQHPGRQ